MSTRLAGWKTSLLNIVGRTILAKAVLVRILNHVMQYITLPYHTAKLIDRMERNFISGTTSEKRKMYIISWNIITRTKKNRGLGIQKVDWKNKAILTGMDWRLFNKPDALWEKLLIAKYYRRGQILRSHKTKLGKVFWRGERYAH